MGPAGLPRCAVQAQHNVLVHLSHFPDALNLRRLLHARAMVFHEAARHAALVAPDLVERFLEREQVYQALVQQSRGIASLIGAGGPAVAESQNAVSRLHSNTGTTVDQEVQPLRELARLFTRTYARLATTIERGFDEKLYFVSVRAPQMTNQTIEGVSQPRTRWMPAGAAVKTDVVTIARDRLRPAPNLPPESASGPKEQQAYEAALTHRPARRSAPTR